MDDKCKGGLPSNRCCLTQVEWGEFACSICEEFANPQTRKISDNLANFLTSLSREELVELRDYLKEG